MENKEREIFKYLISIDCCKSCAFRYVGCSQKNYYMDNVLGVRKFLELTEDEESAFRSKRPKENSCVVCLGLLQPNGVATLLEAITNNKEIKNYDSTNFAFAVSLPMSQQIREYSMSLHLQQKFGTAFHKDKEISLKEACKWAIGSKLTEKIKKSLDNGAISDFLIAFNMTYKDDEKELKMLLEVCPEIFNTRRTERRKYHGETFSRKGVDDVLEQAKPDEFVHHVPCPPTIPDYSLTCGSIVCTHNSIYFAGRYLKLSRTLSQTPWFIDGVKQMDTSVQEIICDQLPVLFWFGQQNIKFSSSGREDCDVRCLGNGRPFALEIINPKKTKFTFKEFRDLENRINKSNLVKVRDMQLVPRDEIVNIRHGEENKTKVYQALCVSQSDLDEDAINKINNFKELTLDQKTPIRVLHRRPLAVRERKIHSIKATLLDDKKKFILDLETQAGTYVKEFVHGDFGRTVPNLRHMLGAEVDIIALDVTSINLEWPTPVIYG